MEQRINELAFKKIKQILQASEQVTDENFNNIMDFFTLYMADTQLLQRLYYAYKKQFPSLELHHGQDIISFQYDKETCFINFPNKKIEFPKALFAKLFPYVIEITKEILPLGTVVELNPAYFNSDQQPDVPTKIVITERFVAPKEYSSYFPYGGIIYPIGEIQKNTKIHFTDPLIKKIVHHGYQDEAENAFIYLIKEEFIVDKDMLSIEYSKEDMKRFETDVKKEDAI